MTTDNQESSIMFMGLWNSIKEDIAIGKGFFFKEMDIETKAKAKYQFKIMVTKDTGDDIYKTH